MTKTFCSAKNIALALLFLVFSSPAFALQTSASPSEATTAATPAPSSAGVQARAGATTGRSNRQSRRKRYVPRHKTAQPIATGPTQPAQVAPTAEQRARDQKILEQQKAQSARIARENDALTKRVIRDQQRVQAEPRIQSAPGVNDQPLPGAAVIPPTQPTEPPRIQDAPGPAQTLPKPAPVTSTPQ